MEKLWKKKKTSISLNYYDSVKTTSYLHKQERDCETTILPPLAVKENLYMV